MKPSACGAHVLKVGMKVSMPKMMVCAIKKGLSSRVSASRGTLDTLDVTKSKPPTGGVIMPSVKLKITTIAK